MAVAERRQDQPIASQTNTSVLVARVDDVELGHAAGEAVTVTKIPGRLTVLRNDVYIHTNFYIKTSRPYIPHGKLRTYWYIRYMVGAFVFYFGLIPPVPFLPDFIGWPWALVTGVIGMVWFVIFVQHAHVVCWTIPKLLSQPVLPDSKQPDPNEYYEIKVDRLEGIFLRAKNSGVGIWAAASESIKIQALNETAAYNVKTSAVLSVVCLIITIISLVVSVGVFCGRIVTDDNIIMM